MATPSDEGLKKVTQFYVKVDVKMTSRRHTTNGILIKIEGTFTEKE